MPETQTQTQMQPKPEAKPKPRKKAEPSSDDLVALRSESAAAAIEQLSRDNIGYIESGERQAPSTLYDSIEDLIAIVAEGPQLSWNRKSWEFLEHVVSIAKLVDESKSEWRTCPPKFHQRLMFFLQRAIDQVDNLLDHTPPKDTVVDLETIEECKEQKLTDDQIARLYGWYTPDGRTDRKKVKAAKAGDVTPPATATHEANVGGPERQPHLGDLDSCLSLFCNQ